jgi:polygalacturonase
MITPSTSNPKTLANVVGVCLYAQDTRKVTEPTVPSTCTVLTAQYSSKAGVLATDADVACSKDSTACDTARVQAALDLCSQRSAGKQIALELKAEGAKNAFLLQPVQLRENVALVVDKDVTVFASINPPPTTI